MKQEIIREIHYNLFEFMALYHEKFGGIFQKLSDPELCCNKSQNKAIVILKRYGKMTATELGKKMDMQRGSLTTLVDILEGLELVAREPDLTDRRKHLLMLTPKGQEYFRAMSQIYEEQLRQLFLTIPSEEVEEFSEKLTHIINIIKKL